MAEQLVIPEDLREMYNAAAAWNHLGIEGAELQALIKRIAALEADLRVLRERAAEAEAERKLLWAALTNEVGVERVYALTEAVIAARLTPPAPTQKGNDDNAQ